MARVIPDGWTALRESLAARRELETLARLGRQLPDAYTVYHGVHWTRLEQGCTIFGDVDFIVVNRRGDLLLIEQKSGLLVAAAEGLLKADGTRRRNVQIDLARTRDALATRLRTRAGCDSVAVEALLYCPDFAVHNPVMAGIVPERIIDQSRSHRLAAAICALLPPGEDLPHASQVHRFLQNLIDLEPDVSVMIGQADALVTRLAGGLAHWARQIEMAPYRLRVQGCAGSGKTQLALAEFRDCIARGGRPLYVCYNRPLADHFARISPAGGSVLTFHGLCDLRLRRQGEIPDYGGPDPFAALEARAAGLPVQSGERFDTLIVDEGQDFIQSWADQLLQLLAPDARCLWLEDREQNLYQRAPVSLPGWTLLHADGNYRSPRAIVDFLNALRGADPALPPSRSESPLQGDAVEMLVYASPDVLVARVREALRLCWSAGFRTQDTVVLSFHGRERSVLLQLDTLGPESVRRFTGRYDLLGMPVFTPGRLLAESVLRFKGQSAPAVVLAEVDCASLDAQALRRLWVGATRARLKLVLVVSAAGAAALAPWIVPDRRNPARSRVGWRDDDRMDDAAPA